MSKLKLDKNSQVEGGAGHKVLALAEKLWALATRKELAFFKGVDRGKSNTSQ